MIVIRTCAGFDELEACVQLQMETWGYDGSDVIPRKAFLVAQKIGGQVIGAFDTEIFGGQPEGGPESLVGFAMSLPGVKTGQGEPKAYLHSHMLAVREAYRNRGLGMQLKREQRREALSRGIRQMEWTFDPLEIKNAYLNIEKLGAIARRYNVNQYGITSSPLQGGLPSDRLVAEWWMKSKRVEAALTGARQLEFQCDGRIQVPAEIYEWKGRPSTRPQALAVEEKNRQLFNRFFAEGLAVLGYERDARGDGTFLLGPWDEGWRY